MDEQLVPGDQDFFRFSGIYRDVYLYCAGSTCRIDVKVRALPDTALTAAELALTFTDVGSGLSVVLKKDGQTVLEDESAVTEGEQIPDLERGAACFVGWKTRNAVFAG